MSNATLTSIAAIELGSNSFHLIVSKTGQDNFRVVDRMREMVQFRRPVFKIARRMAQPRLATRHGRAGGSILGARYERWATKQPHARILVRSSIALRVFEVSH